MIIQHNIMALNANRYRGNNSAALSGNLEKLSSGYKINRAGDDAAGLAISEKMRAQITGLDAAQQNVKDTISLVQTAEGALQEVQDMLNRMVELATKSSNGTYDNTVDRAALQDEVFSLSTEINRIGATANFNGICLFHGQSHGQIGDLSFQIGESAHVDNVLHMCVALGVTEAFNMDLKSFFITALDYASDNTVTASTGFGSQARVDVSNITNALDTIAILKGGEGKTANVSAENGLINQISTYRAKLGAVQNRLEHTMNNLEVMEENIQDAESTIRDTDIAEEMMAYTKNNILIQSSQAMLAQANQVPQGVLQLMQ